MHDNVILVVFAYNLHVYKVFKAFPSNTCKTLQLQTFDHTTFPQLLSVKLNGRRSVNKHSVFCRMFWVGLLKLRMIQKSVLWILLEQMVVLEQDNKIWRGRNKNEIQ